MRNFGAVISSWTVGCPEAVRWLIGAMDRAASNSGFYHEPSILSMRRVPVT